MGLFKNSKPVQPVMTPEEKCEVLGELWLNYRDDAKDDDSWSDFFDYNDIGLPLSYMVYQDLVDGLTEDADTVIDETWEMFCSYIDVDPTGHYSSLQEAFAASPNPPLEVDDDSPRRSMEAPQDYGLEGFLGNRPAVEPTYGDWNKRGLNVSDDAWRQIGKTCRVSRRGNVARARVYVLPCKCGGHKSGIVIEENQNHDDVVVGHGSETVVMDPESAKNARGSSLDANDRGFYITHGPARVRDCECGDNWKPTMAVAGSALALGIVNRNSSAAREWWEDSGTQADSGDTGSGDTGGGDFDFGMDFGAF